MNPRIRLRIKVGVVPILLLDLFNLVQFVVDLLSCDVLAQGQHQLLFELLTLALVQVHNSEQATRV